MLNSLRSLYKSQCLIFLCLQYLQRFLAQNSRLKIDLLALDEIGYVSLGVKKAQLLFDVIAKRSEAGSSMFVTSNYEFSKWKDFIGDIVLTKALVGKLAGNSIVLNMNGEDYRLASRKTQPLIHQ